MTTPITEMFTDLPNATNANMTDIIAAVQGYVSSSDLGSLNQETLQQVFNLFLANAVLSYAGNPNGHVAGTTYQLLWDTTHNTLWVNTVYGDATTAVWTLGTSLLPASIAASLAFNTTSGIIGTTTNNNAAAGSVGEFIPGSKTFGTPVALTSDMPSDLVAITLTAGDYDVWGNVGFVGNSATLLQYGQGWSSQTSSTVPTLDFLSAVSYAIPGVAVFANSSPIFNIQTQRISLSNTTNIYLSVQAGFTINTCSAFGNIRARRVR